MSFSGFDRSFCLVDSLLRGWFDAAEFSTVLNNRFACVVLVGSFSSAGNISFRLLGRRDVVVDVGLSKRFVLVCAF